MSIWQKSHTFQIVLLRLVKIIENLWQSPVEKRDGSSLCYHNTWQTWCSSSATTEESHVFALFAPVVETLSMLGDFSTSVVVSGHYELWVNVAVAIFVRLEDLISH